MQDALDAAGYRTPTPIQGATIAPALRGRDVIGAAQTGTGKTAAFMIPVIERLRAARETDRQGTALVLAPTRELAEQIHLWAERLGVGLHSVVVGGVGYGPQLDALRRRPADSDRAALSRRRFSVARTRPLGRMADQTLWAIRSI
jgi:ATP-dependent RNA helicase RhlE